MGKRGRRQGWTSREIDFAYVKRGLMVLGFGYILNLLTPSWLAPLSWFVLHLIGLSIALGPLWRRLPTNVILLLVVALLLATADVQNWLDTPLKIDNERMRDTSMPGG